MRPIDADELKKLRDEYIRGEIKFDDEYDLIDKCPTINAESATCCKDCKYFMKYTREYTRNIDGADGDCYIRIMSSSDKQFCSRKQDDFCSDAVKKEEVTNATN